MRAILRGVALVIVSGFMSCATHCPMHSITIENFTLTVPEEVQLVKRPSMEDFEVYDCSAAGVPILSFYVGNAPSFPHSKDTAKITERTLKGMSVKDVRLGKNHGVSRDTLVEVSDKTWPRFVHFWYDALSQEKSETADRIINSIHRLNQEQSK